MSSTAITVGQTGTTGSEVRSQQDAQDGVIRPDKQQVVRAILEEALAKGVACDLEVARQFYAMMRRATRVAREDPEDMYYDLGTDELNRLHAVMEVIMPDDVANPAAGSAHELLNRRLLRGSEFSLVHTKDPGYGGRLVDCAVTIELHSF